LRWPYRRSATAVEGDAMLPIQPREPDAEINDIWRHELISPLTAIHAHAQMVRRRATRLDALSDGDRAWLIERATLIEAAVAVLVLRIGRIGWAPGPPVAGGDGSSDGG